MRMQRIIGHGLVVLATALALGVVPRAQRGDLERRAYEDKVGGYRIKLPREWPVVPPKPEMREQGLALQADAERDDPAGGHFRILLLDEENDLADWIDYLLGSQFDGLRGEFEEDAPELDERLVVDGLPTHHRRWLADTLWIDGWVFEREGKDLGVLFTVDSEERYAKSWLSTIEKAAKGVETFEPSRILESQAGSYAERLEQARAQAARTPGWQVHATPTEKFILTTSSDDQKFIDEVIERLERSRTVFEEDYPPPPDFRQVSIVRLCNTAEEFHRYGGTGGGVLGWFNPRSTELVLFDAKTVDRNMSYAVMTHEAFHQYCYFLFGRAEAHRWFDEGHGDYYGGMKFNARGKPKITARMPSGLERLSGARQMVQDGSYVPLREHLNYTHPEWQSHGVPSYEQSWSIVYMLRQGMLGNVNRKVWRKEYADILPAYIATLRKGFEEAFAAEREKRLKEAAESGENTDATSASGTELSSGDLDPEVKAEIWKKAMGDAWGNIDLDQFEEDWKLYVKKYLDD
jgi:hypothetical protein